MLTIYKASAGSGKTYTLTLEYIRTLLGIRDHDTGRYLLNIDRYAPGGHRQPCRHNTILAITFTNAATEEMKSRIVERLGDLADRSKIGKAQYCKELCDPKCFGCTPEELCDAAHLALSELLLDYSAFNVSTIDSFFQTVLRTFAREIDQQGDFEVSLEREELIRQAVSLMLDELNDTAGASDPALFRWIKDYMMACIADGSGYNFFNRDGYILGKLAQNMDKSMDETFVRYSDALDAYLVDPGKLDSFRRQLKAAVDGVFAGAVAAGEALEAFRDRNGLPQDYLKKIESRIAYARNPRGKRPDITTKVFTEGPDATDLSLFLKKEYVKLTPDRDTALILFRDFVARFVACFPKLAVCKELLDATGLLAFIGHTRAALASLLRENNTVLISDTAELLARIINDAEMPFIYERLGMRIHHLLIDEFQDTSRLQWQNLKPLMANSLAYGNDNLIIGDVKQSIYRFRNSDSRLLGSDVQTVDFPTRHVSKGDKPAENTNHRSARDIVLFNNAIFARMAESLAFGEYSGVRQTVRHTDLPAYIRLCFHGDKPDEVNGILAPMAQEIIRQHEAGYAWGQILILTRKRNEAQRVVRYLTDNHPDIRLLSSEALLLSSSDAVRSIISALKLVERSFEGKQPAGSSVVPKYATNGDITMMIVRYNHFLSQGYDSLTALERALDRSDESSESIRKHVQSIREKNPANLVALIETVIELKLTPAQRSSEYAYIAALVDRAIRHLETPDPSLSAFLAEYDRNEQKWAILASASVDAVRVMTVHTSKGLESDCVHIPFGSWELMHNEKRLWLDFTGLEGFEPDTVPPICRVRVTPDSPLSKCGLPAVADAINEDNRAEIMDNLNTTYVAFTRAKRELNIYIDKTTGSGTEIYKAFRGIADSGELPFTTAETELEEAEAYVLGSPTAPSGDKAKSDTTVINAGEYTACSREDTRKIFCIDDIFSDDEDTGDEEPKHITDCDSPFEGTPQMREASRRGTNMHAILASMLTRDDLDASARRLCTRMGLPDTEREEYVAILSDAFDKAGDTARRWFDKDNIVYAERSFYNPVNGVTSRPDRIVILPDGATVVVDYKFTSAVGERHKEQVRGYCWLLKDTGNENVEGYLWYPLLGKIIKV